MAAIARVKSDIVHDLADGADPRQWLKVAPWTTLAGAAVAGFLAAAAVVPSKEEQALRRLRKLEKALEIDHEVPRRNGRHSEDGKRAHTDDGKAQASKGTALGSIIGALAGAVQPMLMNLVTNAFAAKGMGPMPGGDGAAPAGTPTETPGSSQGGPNASQI